MNPPTEAEALTLLRHGNPGRKIVVAWFMEKVMFHTPLLNTQFNIYQLTNARNNFNYTCREKIRTYLWMMN